MQCVLWSSRALFYLYSWDDDVTDVHSLAKIQLISNSEDKMLHYTLTDNLLIVTKELDHKSVTGEWRFVPPFTNIWQHDRVFGMKIFFWWFFAGVRKRNFFRDLWRGVRKCILFLKIIPDVRNYCCTEDRNRKSKISLADRFKVQNRMFFAVSDIVLEIVTTNIECRL
jgi:hypothetical protein